MKLNSIEDLDYNIKPFIDSLFLENKIMVDKVSDFNIENLEYFSAKYGNGKIEKYLNDVCEKGNYDALIIIKSFGNKNNRNYILATDLNPELDFGIVSFENPQRKIFYYNNIIFLYYIKKNGKLLYPIRKRNENLFYDLTPIKFDNIVYDINDKKLLNKKLVVHDFLKDLHNRLKLNFEQMTEELKKE